MTRSILTAAAVLACASALSGCGTITQGISQDIAISSTPPGAQCDLTRPDGTNVGSLAHTPGSLNVRKSKYDLLMTCTLPGYQTASTHLVSGYGIGTFGNIILGGGIGWAIDSSTGADNKYPSSADVTFVPVGQPAPPAPAQNPDASTAKPSS